MKSAAAITDIIKDSTSFMLSGSNVRCDLQLPDDLWPVHIDEGQISQVIQNVIKNADQAMPEGGTIKVKAAGGIRDWDAFQEMLAAGADRIGTSAGVEIMRQWQISAGLI